MDTSGGQISWSAFKHEFCEKYYPLSARFRNRKIFLELKQGNRSVEEYEIEFTLLSRFAPHMVETEEEKTELFIKGLRPLIQGSVSAHASQDFVTAFNAAVKLDAFTLRSDCSSISQVRKGSKRRYTQMSSGSQQQAI